MKGTLELAKNEIGKYLDSLFEELLILKVIKDAQDIAQKKQLGDEGKLVIMFLTKEILN